MDDQKIDRLLSLSEQMLSAIDSKPNIKKTNSRSLIGWSVGDLIVIGESHLASKAKNRAWLCLCRCGKQFTLEHKEIPKSGREIDMWRRGSTVFFASCKECSMVDCAICGEKYLRKGRGVVCGKLDCFDMRKKEIARLSHYKHKDAKNQKLREKYAGNEDLRKKALNRALKSRCKKSDELKRLELNRLAQRERYANDPDYRERKIANQKAYRKRKSEIDSND